MRICYYLLILVITFCLPAFSQETFTLTTYYPAPFGVYNELRSKRMAIGDTYYQQSAYPWATTSPTPSGQISQYADLAVEGNVGIGTVDPQGQLHLKGVNPMVLFEDDEIEERTTELTAFTIQADNGVACLESDKSAAIFIDDNNDDADKAFMVLKNANSFNPPAEELFRVQENGDVGIGTVTPQAKLDVNGGVRVGIVATCGNNIEGCSSSNEGTMRYCSNKIQYCNGKTWASVLRDNYTFVEGTSDVSTSSRSYVLMPDMSINLNTNGGPVLVEFSTVSGNWDSYIYFCLYVDGKRKSVGSFGWKAEAHALAHSGGSYLVTGLPAGVHNFSVYWMAPGGTAYNSVSSKPDWYHRNLFAAEL